MEGIRFNLFTGSGGRFLIFLDFSRKNFFYKRIIIKFAITLKTKYEKEFISN